MANLNEKEIETRYNTSQKQDGLLWGWNGCNCKECSLKRFHQEWKLVTNPNKRERQTEVIKLLKQKLEIKSIAENIYGMKFKGNMACCPFHEEKTPSFYINPFKNVFCCFGCGSFGDCLEFIQLMEERE